MFSIVEVSWVLHLHPLDSCIFYATRAAILFAAQSGISAPWLGTAKIKTTYVTRKERCYLGLSLERKNNPTQIIN